MALVGAVRATMSISTTAPEMRLDSLPEGLESPRAKLVYLALAAGDGATLAELHETLDVPKLTLLSVLDALNEQDLVATTDDRYVPAA